jgi:hypothetical protein
VNTWPGAFDDAGEGEVALGDAGAAEGLVARGVRGPGEGVELGAGVGVSACARTAAARTVAVSSARRDAIGLA